MKVERAAEEKDQVVIDFEGKIDGEGFEGNESFKTSKSTVDPFPRSRLLTIGCMVFLATL